jgi:S-formylglutathione hydrolase FrmB
MILKNWKFISEKLNTNVDLGVIEPDLYERVMIFLHGYESCYEDIQRNLPIEELAEQYKILVIIPNVASDYYIDQDDYHIQEFIGRELPEQIKSTFPGSAQCPFYIGGISMGGYGSILIGSLYPDIFHAIFSISGALITDDVLIGNPEVVGSGQDRNVTAYFQRVFGPLDTYETDEKRNPFAAVNYTAGQQALPAFFLACGSRDLLFSRNVKFLAHLRAKNIPVVWEEIPDGIHNWECFEKGLCRLFIHL